MLAGTIEISPERTQLVVMACCVLHNFLRTKYPRSSNLLLDRESVALGMRPGTWRQDVRLEDLETIRGNNATKAGKAVRSYMTSYFLNEGSVPWQEKQAHVVLKVHEILCDVCK